MEDRRVVEPLRLPVIDGRLVVQLVHPPDHLVHRPEAELRHVLADFLGDEPEEILDELRFPGEVLPQHRILCRDADRTGVEVADAHHDAARHDQRRRGEAELLGAHQRGDDHVAAGLQLTVDLHDDAVAQAVDHQHLLGFREAQLPRHAAVLDRGQRRRAGAAVMPRDQHDVGVRLRHAGGDRADAGERDQLHVDARLRVRVLQVVDELRQILDRVDVVVRRRRDQSDARRGVAHLRDPRIDLAAGELTAFAGLGALRHLDLQIGAIHQVAAGDAESRRRDLADRAAAPVAVGVGHVARRIFAALAGVGFSAEAVHRDRQRLVRFLADRSVGHRAGREALDDAVDGSTSSIGIGCASVSSSSSPRSVARSRLWSSTSFEYSLKTRYWPLRVECCSLKTVSGLNR